MPVPASGANATTVSPTSLAAYRKCPLSDLSRAMANSLEPVPGQELGGAHEARYRISVRITWHTGYVARRFDQAFGHQALVKPLS